MAARYRTIERDQMMLLTRPLLTPPDRCWCWVVGMRRVLESERGQQIHKLHKQSVEPVFGILKQAMEFRQFLLRGLEKTNLEGELVTIAKLWDSILGTSVIPAHSP